jgi:hypothetical protein
MAVQKNFKITNGLEVNTNLIFADTNSNKVGIATTTVNYTLDVNGDIGTETLNVVGVTTLTDLVINGSLSALNGVGTTDQYLASIGTGVTWKDVVSPRTTTTYQASSGQTTFSASYTVGLVDVYINGVKMVSPPSPYAEFTASSGTNIILNDACFGSEIVEIVVYNQL